MSTSPDLRATATTAEHAVPVPASEPAPGTHTGFGATDLGLILMAVIWGVNYTVVKSGLAVMTPLAFNGARVALAAVVLFAVAALVRDQPWPEKRDVWRLLALGLMGNGIYQLLFIFGMAHTRAGVAALIVAAGPAWIAIISRLLGRERLPFLGWAGIGLQLVGVGCVVGSTSALESGGTVMLGAALIAAGSITWAAFSVLLQPYTKRAHPLHLSAITMASGALLIGLVAIPDLRALDWASLTWKAWGAVVYAGIGALVVAYLLFYRGVRVLGPTRTAMYGNLQPIIALAVAALLLNELPSVWQLIGAAFIMAGLLLSRSVSVRPSTRVSLSR
ncbi:MAG: EamA family transporter [Gemmatimonadaceae bacterium]|nr:EamA family transporter [Gemmatimonadaceae bacterium]